MSKTESLITQIKETVLFHQVENIILNFTADIKSHMWTRELLTYNINLLIDRFLSSEFEQIDDFFKNYLNENFGNVDRKKQKFCFNLVLSLNHFSPKFNYLRMYQKMLSQQKHYAYYNFFWELKDEILTLKLDRNNFYVNLDSFFLDQKKWQLLLQKSLNFKLKQIKEFEKEIADKISNIKREHLVKYVSDLVRNEEFNATFFIEEVLERFLRIYQKNKKTKTNIAVIDNEPVKDAVQTDYEDLIRKATQNRASRLADGSFVETQAEIYKSKLLEKERLKTEIKNAVSQQNKYKGSTAKLLSYIKEIDPIIAETKSKIQKRRDCFLASRKQALKGENAESFSSQTTAPMTNFLENGSALFSTNGSAIKRKLLGLSVERYGQLEERSMDYCPVVRALIARLRKVIFNANFSLAKNADQESLEKVREDIDRIFKDFQNLNHSQVIILDTFFNNLDGVGVQGKSVQVNSVLDNVSKKLLNIVDKALQTNDEAEQHVDQMIRQEFETFKQILSTHNEDSQKRDFEIQSGKGSYFRDKKNGLKTNDSKSKNKETENEFKMSLYELGETIQPMKYDFRQKNFFLNKKEGFGNDKNGVENLSFYEIQRVKSAETQQSERKLEQSQVEQHSYFQSDVRANKKRQSNENQNSSKISKLIEQNNNSLNKNGSLNVIVKETEIANLDELVRESQGRIHRESQTLGSNMVQLESLEPEAIVSPKPSNSKNVPRNIPDESKRTTKLKEVPHFASFTRDKSPSRQTSNSKDNQLKENTIEDLSKAKKSGQVKADHEKRESSPMVEPKITIIDSAEQKNSREIIRDEGIEGRFSEIPMSIHKDSDLDAPIDYNSSAKKQIPDVIPEENAHFGANEVDSDDGELIPGSRRYTHKKHSMGKSNDKSLKDKLKEKNFMNSQQGQKMAQEIGTGQSGEKKNIKNFFAGFLGKK